MAGDGYRVGVMGATGAVGTTILRLLHERGFPAREVVGVRERALGGQGARVGRRNADRAAAERRDDPGRRRGAVLAGRRGQRRVVAALRRGGGDRRRQHLLLAHARGRAAGRRRRQRRGGGGPPGHRRQPQLHDDDDDDGAGADPPRGRPRALHRVQLPGGLGDRAEGDRRAARAGDRRSSPATSRPRRRSTRTRSPST